MIRKLFLASLVAALAGMAPMPPAVDLSTLPVNTWVDMNPTYEGAPNGGSFAPQCWNNKGAYDPTGRRVLIYDRWVDPIHSGSIYANAVMGYDPSTNVVSVLKLNNMTVVSPCPADVLAWDPGCGYVTLPLPENATDPTPVDRHPLQNLAVVPELNRFYLGSGLNGSALRNGGFGESTYDTWALDLAQKKWNVVSGLDVRPVPGGSMMAYDSANRKLVSFSTTSDGSGMLIWLLDPFTGQWSKVSDQGSGPWIGACGVAYDSRRSRILLFASGWDPPSSSPRLWAYSVAQNTWTRLADCPIPGYAPGFDYDSTHDVFLALIGTRTFIYSPQSDSWQEIATPMPRVANMSSQPVTYDAAHDVFVFAGGHTGYAPAQWMLFRYGGAPVPDTQAPTVPTGLSATTVSPSRIDLMWSASSDNVGVTGYNVYRGGTQIGTSTLASYSDTGLSASTGYTYTVAAFDTAGNVSSPSTETSATTSPEPSSPPPSSGGSTKWGCGLMGLETAGLLGFLWILRRLATPRVP